MRSGKPESKMVSQPNTSESREAPRQVDRALPIAIQIRRTLRRADLRKIVPLSDTTIYEMERRGEFPRRFNLTARCVVWDMAEVEAWLASRREASESNQVKRAPSPNVHQRTSRPVKAAPAS